MGEKGAKLTEDSTHNAEVLVEAFAPLGDVRSKKMFGGHGIFGDDVMFSIVDSAGRAFLRVDDSTRDKYEGAGSEAHGRMPYQSIPESVLADGDELTAWGREALEVAKANKK